MSGQIFLYTAGGRTLWVPRHTPTATETKPVCMLNYVTPMELSRSFYLFDYQVQVVESAQMAAMNPNAKTPNEILAAVNDFRRLCAEDQSFLLQRCYNPQQQQPQSQPQPQPQQPPQHNYQGSYPQSVPSSSMGGVQTYDTSKPAGGTNTMDNAALLAQLLQQQRQQQPQQQMPMMGGGGSGGYGDDTSNQVDYYGGGRGGGGVRGGRRGGMYNNMSYMPDMMQQQANPMMMGGYSSPSGYGMDAMMMGGYSNVPYQRSGRGGRRDAQMYGNYNSPMMMPQQQMMMMSGGMGGRRGMMGGNNMSNQSRMAPYARHEPEPITIDVAIPDEIKSVYTNPAQQLVIATMPGPHMTVWLREHPIPTDTQDKKYVFGKNGVILMLKAAFVEVKDSKPVELFPKQICTHFFIYGYCSRENCFHEHHNEQQLRELIAARHVQLKAMTKVQRHQLIAEIEEKDKAGVAAAEAQRAEREKRRAEAMAEREARRQQRQQAREPALPQQQQQQSSYSVPSSQPNPSQDIGSDNEDEVTVLGGGSQSLADMIASSPSQDLAANATATTAAEDAAKTPASDVMAKLGITDSDEEDGNDDDASSSKSSGDSSASATSERAMSEEKEEPVATEATEAKGEAKAEAHGSSGEDEDEDEEEAEEAEKEEAEEEKEAKKAKTPAPKKRGRPAAPKRSAKRAKK
ncbi:hypothetical protein ABL78_1197 [Leptomonas seymouri]|uniref:C3H1-type domain-containing protein n=1 Tax=Leptomonas seymouri TaxID=5684 RepID=A0A0N1PDX4_LEPSE|nr:hypothetical protein ABL78_1197 [Leptomonas seymouri]|eukprot:KPI89704.1 hypothetical protein ABL78_1197 [Leptomonas seymouri]